MNQKHVFQPGNLKREIFVEIFIPTLSFLFGFTAIDAMAGIVLLVVAEIAFIPFHIGFIRKLNYSITINLDGRLIERYFSKTQTVNIRDISLVDPAPHTDIIIPASEGILDTYYLKLENRVTNERFPKYPMQIAFYDRVQQLKTGKIENELISKRYGLWTDMFNAHKRVSMLLLGSGAVFVIIGYLVAGNEFDPAVIILAAILLLFAGLLSIFFK